MMKKNIFKLTIILFLFMVLYNRQEAFAIEDGLLQEKDQMELQATVVDQNINYYVTVPETISLGQLLGDGDTEYNYQIQVEMENKNQKGTVTITSQEELKLINQVIEKKDTLTCLNYFPVASTTESNIFQGKVVVQQDQIKNAPAGQYAGTMQFNIQYVENEESMTDIVQKESIKVISKINGAGANMSTLKAFAKQNTQRRYQLLIQFADSKKNAIDIAEIATLIASSGQNGLTTYYDFSLCDELENQIKDTQEQVIEMWIPLNSQMSLKSLYRYHEDMASNMQMLLEKPTSNYKDGTYFVDTKRGVIYIYTSKFSTFAAFCTQQVKSEITKKDVTLKNGKYTANVVMKKDTNINEISMCNGLFFKQADIEISGNEAKLYLYVIDPIPAYPSEGTPLKDIRMHFDEKTYQASVDSSSKVGKNFDQAAGFINSAGNYEASTISVLLPVDAIQESKNGKLSCTTFVQAVMKMEVSFCIELSNLEEGNTLVETVTKKTQAKKQELTTVEKTEDANIVEDTKKSKTAMYSTKKSQPPKDLGEIGESEPMTMAEDFFVQEQAREKSEQQRSVKKSIQYKLVTDVKYDWIWYLGGTLGIVLVWILIIRKKGLKTR